MADDPWRNVVPRPRPVPPEFAAAKALREEWFKTQPWLAEQHAGTCASCHFYIDERGRAPQGAVFGGAGQCRRFPPAAGGAFPHVRPRTWCGEHKPRAADPMPRDWRPQELQEPGVVPRQEGED